MIVQAPVRRSRGFLMIVSRQELGKQLEGCTQSRGCLNRKSARDKMETHLLASHEYMMPMHIYGQIEKPSPVIWQHMIIVHALRKDCSSCCAR